MHKLKAEAATLIDCRALDKFVNMRLESFGKTWRALDTNYDGYHNGSCEIVRVQFGEEIEEDMDQSFTRWLTDEGPFYADEEGRYSLTLPSINGILQWLCNSGDIPEGTYVIHLWW